MKKIILTISIFVSLFLVAMGDNLNQALHIFHDGKSTPEVIPAGAIEKIEFEADGEEATGFKYIVHTEDGKKELCHVDSIRLNLPHLKGYKHLYTIPDEEGEIVINVSCADNEEVSPVICLPNGEREIMGQGEDCFTYTLFHEKRDKESYDTIFVENNLLKDTLILHNTGRPFLNGESWTMVTFPREGGDFFIETSFPINYSGWGNIEMKYYEGEGLDIRMDAVKESVPGHGYAYIDKAGDLGLYHDVSINQLDYAPMHSAEEHRAALEDLYNKCNGENWRYKRNWLSQRPVWEWEGINNNIWGEFWKMDYVRYVQNGARQYTGLRGILPESFTVLMDDAEEMDMSQGAIYGEIPYSVRHHEKWQTFGWSFLDRNSLYGDAIDFEDINLHVDDVETENFITGEKSTTYKQLAKNKYTWVFNGGMVDAIGGISDRRVNKYLDYKDKGLGLVVTVHEFWETPYDNYKEWVEDKQQRFGLPEEIQWTKGFDKGDYGSLGSMSLLDSVGNLMHHFSYIYHIYQPEEYEEYVVNMMDSVLRKHLGEPLPHETYSSAAYASSDFSEDGKVVTLQRSSVGRGIDLVLLGDQYIDKWMGEDGMYEKDMREAMDRFFSVEPFTSMRDRFNVYTVKVVSKNAYDGSDHRINHNRDVVMEYVSKIPDIDLDNLTVAVIKGDPNFQWTVQEGDTDLMESGVGISYLDAGGSALIVHEAGGHAFGKLLDEDISNCLSDNDLPDEVNEEFKSFIKERYHDLGWGLNISATDNPDEVPWAKFLKDSRYQDEVGIFQGAWAYPFDLWRSSETSIMRDAQYHSFNVPSREAIYKRIMTLSEGEDWEYDYETFVAFDRKAMKKSAAKTSAKVKDNYSVSFTRGKDSMDRKVEKDPGFIRADLYKGDKRHLRAINIEGTVYVRE